MARKKLSKRLQRKIKKRLAEKVWRVAREPAVKFTMFVRPISKPGITPAKPWAEDFVVETKDPDEWARKHIQRFNASRVKGEQARELVYTVPRGRCQRVLHTWKLSNPQPMLQDGVWVTTYICQCCGVTGRREGLFGPIERDPKFSAPLFKRCDIAAPHVQSSKKPRPGPQIGKRHD